MTFSGDQLYRGSTLVTFDITSAVPNTNPAGSVDCSHMDLKVIRLYVDPAAAVAVQNVTVRGANVPFSVVSDVYGTALSIQSGLPSGSFGQLALALAGAVTPQSVCSYRVGEYNVCNYVLDGLYSAATAAYQCCTQGDVAVSTVTVPRIQVR